MALFYPLPLFIFQDYSRVSAELKRAIIGAQLIITVLTCKKYLKKKKRQTHITLAPLGTPEKKKAPNFFAQ